jgi:cell division protein FtsA
MKPTIVAIDLGSCFVRVVVGVIEDEEKGVVNVIGRSYSNLHQGATNAGNIANLEKMRMALKKAVEEAELMADVEVERAFVGISSPGMVGFDAEADVTIQGKRRQVSREDIDNAFKAVREIGIPAEHKVLHIIPQRYLVDKQGEYEDPSGATGARLTIQAHTLVCPAAAHSNHTAICNQLGIRVARFIFEPLAAAEAVLTQDERERGVLLVDLGHETTQTLLIRRSSILHTFLQPYGARHVTTDLVEVLGVGQLEADRVKREIPLEYKNGGDELEEGVELHQAVTETKKLVRKKMISDVMGARLMELFTDIREDLVRHHLEGAFRGGVVLTGGGALLKGVDAMGQRLFQAPVRVGYPALIEGIVEEIARPDWTTVIGLIKFGFKYYPEECRSKRGLISKLFGSKK